MVRIRTVDMRSDTVTKPGKAMREAMAAAEVGDDVMQEDPTIKLLEQRCASLLGKEAALFTPSTSMSNLIAVMIHCRDWASELIVGDAQHIARYERGTYAHIARASAHVLPNLADGTIDLELVKTALRNPLDIHQPRTALLCLEDTHNVCGGKILPEGYVKEARRVLDAHTASITLPDNTRSTTGAQHNFVPTPPNQRIMIHLDGARLYNASIGGGVPLSTLCQDVDSVALCLSKGLGAPVGGVLCGDHAFIYEARRLRKSLGGGMRQAGVLAAAAMHGLDTADARLAKDHEHAKMLAVALNEMENGMTCEVPHTNIIMLNTGKHEGPVVSKRLNEAGVLTFSLSPSAVRLVLHSDISTEDVQYAIEVIKKVTTAM